MGQQGEQTDRALIRITIEVIIFPGKEANETGHLPTEVGKLNKSFPVHLKYLN